MLAEIRKRLDLLKMEPLDRPIAPGSSQADLAAAIEKASHLPNDPARPGGRGLWADTNGLRVFGWTHAFTIPYALRTLEDVDLKAKPPLRKPVSTR